MSQLQSLRGMLDFLPEQSRRWHAVEAFAREHFRRAGIGEIRTPLLEVTELFARGIGEGTDVVGKEMYSSNMVAMGMGKKYSLYLFGGGSFGFELR